MGSLAPLPHPSYQALLTPTLLVPPALPFPSIISCMDYYSSLLTALPAFHFSAQLRVFCPKVDVDGFPWDPWDQVQTPSLNLQDRL